MLSNALTQIFSLADVLFPIELQKIPIFRLCGVKLTHEWRLCLLRLQPTTDEIIDTRYQSIWVFQWPILWLQVSHGLTYNADIIFIGVFPFDKKLETQLLNFSDQLLYKCRQKKCALHALCTVLTILYSLQKLLAVVHLTAAFRVFSDEHKCADFRLFVHFFNWPCEFRHWRVMIMSECHKIGPTHRLIY